MAAAAAGELDGFEEGVASLPDGVVVLPLAIPLTLPEADPLDEPAAVDEEPGAVVSGAPEMSSGVVEELALVEAPAVWPEPALELLEGKVTRGVSESRSLAGLALLAGVADEAVPLGDALEAAEARD